MAEETPREKSNKNLVPFRPGPDGRRATTGTGRPPIFKTEEELEVFARAVADGMNNRELAELFNIGETSVKRYKKDPRVKALALKAVEDRVLLITRNTDRIIEERLRNAEELDTETILRIRKEFLGGAFRIQTQGGDAKDDKTITEAQQAIEDSPAFAAQLEELLSTRNQ